MDRRYQCVVSSRGAPADGLDQVDAEVLGEGIVVPRELEARHHVDEDLIDEAEPVRRRLVPNRGAIVVDGAATPAGICTCPGSARSAIAPSRSPPSMASTRPASRASAVFATESNCSISGVGNPLVGDVLDVRVLQRGDGDALALPSRPRVL